MSKKDYTVRNFSSTYVNPHLTHNHLGRILGKFIPVNLPPFVKSPPHTWG